MSVFSPLGHFPFIFHALCLKKLCTNLDAFDFKSLSFMLASIAEFSIFLMIVGNLVAEQ